MKQKITLLLCLIVGVTSCVQEAPEVEATSSYQNIISNVKSFHYWEEGYNLYPSWILQTEGVIEYYKHNNPSNAPTDGLNLLFNNGLCFSFNLAATPKEIVIHHLESAINEESFTPLLLPERSNERESADFFVPILWKYTALLDSKLYAPISLRWEVLVDGKVVQYLNAAFTVRDLHLVAGTLELTEKMGDYLVEMGVGGCPLLKCSMGPGGETLKEPKYACSSPTFFMGHINPMSTVYRQLFKEITEDNQLSRYFFHKKYFAFAGNQLLDAEQYTVFMQELKVLAYWVLKNRLTYNAQMEATSIVQYAKTIEEIVKDKQLYCLEIANIVAGYLSSLMYEVNLLLTPNHAYNGVLLTYVNENGEKVKETIYIDFTLLISSCQKFWRDMEEAGYTDMKEILVMPAEGQPENLFESLFERVMTHSKEEGLADYQKIQDPLMAPWYGSLNAREAFAYLPPFPLYPPYNYPPCNYPSCNYNSAPTRTSPQLQPLQIP